MSVTLEVIAVMAMQPVMTERVAMSVHATMVTLVMDFHA